MGWVGQMTQTWIQHTTGTYSNKSKSFMIVWNDTKGSINTANSNYFKIKATSLLLLLLVSDVT